MKKSRFSEHKIMSILKQAEGGVPVAELCREHGMSSASFYKWRSKYGGMDASMMARMKELEAENKRLKKMYADLSLQNDLIKEAMAKKSVWSRSENDPVNHFPATAVFAKRDGPMGCGKPRGQHPSGLRGLYDQPELLSLPAQTVR